MKQKYKTIIVDDESHSRELMHSYLSKYCDEIEVSAIAKNVDDAYEKIITHKPQIVFLDIALLDSDAFDLLAKFNTVNFEIIFITAYNDFAIKAIKLSAIDYLLKPVNIESLVNAVHKAIARIDEKTTINRFRFFAENMKTKEQLVKIALPTLEGYVFVEVDQIVRCHAAGSYTEFFFLNRKSILVSKGLKEYEELLAGHHFVRVHHSHLVNLNLVSEYHKGKLSYIIMADKSSVEVSVRKKDEFLEKLQNLRA
jgi:two-component system LytT family response regulator